LRTILRALDFLNCEFSHGPKLSVPEPKDAPCPIKFWPLTTANLPGWPWAAPSGESGRNGLAEETNASDALDAISNRGVDIALIDFNMPGMDGLELVARIRRTRPQMPVAVVSANIQEEIIARAPELNAAFIAKPLTDEALAAFLSGAALRLKKAG
jgi:CheY-like chemotaxis protein